MLIGLRPGDDAYVDHTGMDFNGQDEGGSGSVAYYEILNTADELKFDVSSYTDGLTSPVLVLNTVWGPTDFRLEETNTGTRIVEEQSGYDSDVWVIDISGTSEQFTLTQFDTGNGVDGTQAAWYAYARLFSA